MAPRAAVGLHCSASTRGGSDPGAGRRRLPEIVQGAFEMVQVGEYIAGVNSSPRWLRTGCASAARTRSGTAAGPGKRRQ
jgi:hypothetical protein